MLLFFYQLLLLVLLHYTFFFSPIPSSPPSLLYINIAFCFPKDNAITFIICIYKHKLEGIVPNAISLLDEIHFGRTLMYTEMTIEIKLFQSLHLHFIAWKSFFKICYYWVTSGHFCMYAVYFEYIPSNISCHLTVSGSSPSSASK